MYKRNYPLTNLEDPTPVQFYRVMAALQEPPRGLPLGWVLVGVGLAIGVFFLLLT